MEAPRFSCRTVEPWDVDHWGFKTAAGLRLWLMRITGNDIKYYELSEIREWIEKAHRGDTTYINADDFNIVSHRYADIEIKCNY